MYDVAIIGAGAVGSAAARHLSAELGADVCVLEKESEVARHQSGRNSGFVFPGVSHPPEAAAAKLLRAGASRIEAFCGDSGVPFRRAGGLVVAASDRDQAALERLEERANKGGVQTEFLYGQEAIREHEPHVVGSAALRFPDAAVVNPGELVKALMIEARSAGTDLYTGCEVKCIRRTGPHGRYRLETTGGTYRARYLINAAGLHADRIARWLSLGSAHRLVPFRARYYHLRAGERGPVQSVVTPVPDKGFPFLRDAFARRPDGSVIFGPAVLPAPGREAYDLAGVDLRDVSELVAFPGTRRLLRRERLVRIGLDEARKSLNPRSVLARARRLIPMVGSEDLTRGLVGIRAQPVSAAGELLTDPLIETGPRSVHVIGVPGLTSAIPLAEECTAALLKGPP